MGSGGRVRVSPILGVEGAAGGRIWRERRGRGRLGFGLRFCEFGRLGERGGGGDGFEGEGEGFVERARARYDGHLGRH